MNRTVKRLFALLLLAGAAASATPEVKTQTSVPEVPDATITISGGVIALGVGYEWLRGTLTYHGRDFPFRLRGLTVMDLAAAKIAGNGEVFNLKSLADFEGTYAGSTFGSAVSRGASLALIKNEKGVAIRARSAVSGIRFNLSGNGFRIRFTSPPKTDGASTSANIDEASAPHPEDNP